jgi:predicted thioesterase
VRFLRRLYLSAAIALAGIFERPAPALIEPPIEQDYDSRLEVTVTVQARHTAPVPAALLAQYHAQAEEFWEEHYRGLPEELAAVTRRVRERACGW